MVAAAKMRKAIEAVLRTRTYANLSWGTFLQLSILANYNHDPLHPLLLKREEIKRACIILITSNRGLCGSFNTAIINKAHNSAAKHQQRENTDFILIGKKGRAVYKYYGYNIAAEFTKEDVVSQVMEILPLSQMVIEDYLSGKYDKVMVAYTDYISATKLVPRVRQLLPVDITTEDEFLGVVGKDTRVGVDKEFIQEKQEKYLYSNDRKLAHE